MIRSSLLVACATVALACAAQAQDAECPSPPENDAIDFGDAEPLAVISGDARHEFDVQIADDPAETSRGLMFRPEIAPDFGMLFVFPEVGERSFYMRNTCASLDIMFVRADGEIASIVRNAVPFSLRSLPSNGPVQFVLEIAGGRAAELGIEPGDRVASPRVSGEAP